MERFGMTRPDKDEPFAQQCPQSDIPCTQDRLPVTPFSACSGFSSQINWLLLITEDPQTLARLQTIKGWLFVCVTAFLFFLLIRQTLATQDKGAHSLRQSEERFRTLLNTIPDLIWLKDASGYYLSCNATFEKFFGATEAEIIGKTDYDFVDRELADFFREHDNKAIEAGKPCNNEEQITFADGSQALLLTTKVAMYDADGKIVGIIGVGRDITELRRAEEERLHLEGQLHQTLKIESIGQLAGGVAHDFNNMLGVILGRTEMALRKLEKSQSVATDLKEIHQAAKRSAELTRQLLTFARKQAIDPKVLDLNETVSGMLDMLLRLIGENIDLTWTPADKLWPVKIDPSQIDQVLANLCVNARDAITGSGHIVIRTENCSIDTHYSATKPYDLRPGDYVKLSVTDDGCGMDEAVQRHIFEPFYTTKGTGSGTGLGLATVYGAVKQNDGFLTFYSESGKGTVFNVFLPRAGAGEETSAAPSSQESISGDETILLVEDDQMLLNLESSMLKESGYQVLAASNAEAALGTGQETSQPDSPVDLRLDHAADERQGAVRKVTGDPPRYESALHFRLLFGYHLQSRNH